MASNYFDCLDNYYKYETINNIYFYYCSQFKKDDIDNNFIQILNRLTLGNDESNTNYNKNYKLEAKDYNVTITPVNYFKSDLKTYEESFYPEYYNFTECEVILRKHYNIPSTKVIGFYRIDLSNSDENGNTILYRAYETS